MSRVRDAATISKSTSPSARRTTVKDSSPCSGWFDRVPEANPTRSGSSSMTTTRQTASMCPTGVVRTLRRWLRRRVPVGADGETGAALDLPSADRVARTPPDGIVGAEPTGPSGAEATGPSVEVVAGRCHGIPRDPDRQIGKRVVLGHKQQPPKLVLAWASQPNRHQRSVAEAPCVRRARSSSSNSRRSGTPSSSRLKLDPARAG
jgi:hypothetical protein